MLACLWRRTRRLILDDIVWAALLLDILFDKAMLRQRQNGEGPRRDGYVGSDPVAHLAPFWIFARGRIGVGQCDDIGWVCV